MNKINTRNLIAEEGLGLIYPAQNVVVPAEPLGVYHIGTPLLYPIGSTAFTRRGRFRYGLSTGECRAGRGVSFGNAIPATGIDYSALVQAQAVGDTSVIMTSPIGQVKNSLVGGTIILSNQVDPTPADGKIQQRCITANTYCGAGGTCTITLDYGLDRAVTTATFAFCMPNPWTNLLFETSGKMSKAGVPAVYVSGAGYHFWTQTEGRLWIAMQGNVGKVHHARQVVFRYDGSLDYHQNPAPSGGTTTVHFQQHAGFIIDNNVLANGATEIMLQVAGA